MVHDNCIIEDFVLPELSSKQFGFLLEWTDEEKAIFRVFWPHKSGRTWDEKYNLVFTTWDKLKGRDSQDEKDYFTNSKSRFRCALNRLKNKVTYLKSLSTKGYRYYQIKLPKILMKKHMAKEAPLPASCISCSPPSCFESSDSEVQNYKNEMKICNSPCASSASPGSSGFEDQYYKIEMESCNSPCSSSASSGAFGFEEIEMESCNSPCLLSVSPGSFDYENQCFTESINDDLTVWKSTEMEGIYGNQDLYSYVLDMDQYMLNTFLHEVMSFDDIQPVPEVQWVHENPNTVIPDLEALLPEGFPTKLL